MAVKETGILEIVAIGCIAYFIYREVKKKRITGTIEMTPEPEDPCKNIVYKPLSTVGLRPAVLLGKDWCSRGDRSVVDPGRGTGDPYAEKQAEKYTEAKQVEAIRVTNKSVVQFRLINTTAVPITTGFMNTTQDVAVVDGTDDVLLPDAPLAISASDVLNTSFTANWQVSTMATGYYLDVARDVSFLSKVSGFDNLDVGNVLTYDLTGLTEGVTYYYRIKSYNSAGASGYSNIITTDTLPYITDIDGNVYDIITIGSRQWLVQNLKTTKYNDGSAIPNITVAGDWITDTAGAYCWYNNNEATYKATYGALYNWYAVDTGKLAPTGWRVPTRQDYWDTITFRIDNEFSDYGYMLKEVGTTHWTTPNTGATDELGWEGLPAGRRRSTDGTFQYNTTQGDTWSSDDNTGNGYRLNLRYNSIEARLNNESANFGFSVRCVRDV